jgi:hypothetical protein
MIPLDSQRHYEIYCRSMLFRGHGYAPWVPEPDDSDPDQLLQGGVDICDVLLLKDDGSYAYVFNCSLPEDDDRNKHGVPPSFLPFSLHKRSVRSKSTFHDRAIISSSEITVTTPSSPATTTSTSPIPYVCLYS